MCNKGIIWFLVFCFSGVISYGQVIINSEKTYLQIKSPTKADYIEIKDNIKPEISIFSPALDHRSRFETSEAEIPLFGVATDKSGIQSLVVNSEFVNFTPEGQFTKRLKLIPGENTIIVGAMDQNMNYREKRIIIDYKPIKISLAERVNKESKYYALIIGINNYSDPAINSLRNPIRDSERLYEILTTKYTFEEENIQFLKDAKREELFYALDYLTRTVTPDDNLLIFYAGHGRWDDDAKIGYWLPSNARKISSAEWFPNSQLVDFLKMIDSKHTLLITDACFSGSIFTARSAFSDAPLAIEKLYELPSRKAMTSGTLTEVPDESSFTKYLIDRLSSNGELYYTASDLFNSLRKAVINNSEAVPQYGEIKNVGDEGGDFIFIRKQ